MKAPKIILVSFALLLLLASTACSAPSVATPDFRESVERHLTSVESRDLETFKTTLTASNDLYAIFPDGSYLENTQAVIDFHREWFSDTEWVFDTEIDKIIEGTTQSTALIKYSYKDTSDGPPRFAWLVLTFQIENGEWRLIHDQNTRIVQKEE